MIVFGWKYLEPFKKKIYKPLFIGFSKLQICWIFLTTMDVTTIHTIGSKIILTQEMNTISIKKIETTILKLLIWTYFLTEHWGMNLSKV
jgi:hypothetical protein